MQRIAEIKLKNEKLTFDKYYWKVLDKLHICQKEKIDLMIDDNYLICKNLSDNFINTVYLRDVKKKKLKENKYLKEVNSWGEIYRYVYTNEKTKKNDINYRGESTFSILQKKLNYCVENRNRNLQFNVVNNIKITFDKVILGSYTIQIKEIVKIQLLDNEN